MTRSLRQRHRAMMYTLGIFLPIAFVVGITARQTVPVVGSVPSEFTGIGSSFNEQVWIKSDLWPNRQFITELRRDAAGSLAVAILHRDLTRPDVLVYWVGGKAAATQNLPGNAQLLGVLSNEAPLPLPHNLRGEIGQLVLYSLADHEVVAWSAPVTFPPRTVSAF